MLGPKGGRRDRLGDKGKRRINSQSISLGGSLLKVPCKILAAGYFAWKYGKSFVRIVSYLQCNYSGSWHSGGLPRQKLKVFPNASCYLRLKSLRVLVSLPLF